ncbi:hypothetical protein PLESTB_001481700 [Pleodorina starrii]|uniref:Uncharacterized protein n=1 Tax=Pleodorina starrii TaxID=330485 RepID=A0A9W6BVR9_9CHLO|nr:hypothetical protein PLESTM_000653200 [Pleodorina starrii]GLC59396.1 hypothetical protein PLESTB_001481700 [Pleodorina starrii]GLC74405.1 hypothetical protein PLESTF_001509600 [Pleodorina starrii]
MSLSVTAHQVALAVNLPDLPDALLQRIIGHLLHLNAVRSVCLVACVCTALQRAAHACLAMSRHLRPPAANCKAALVALLPRLQSLTELDLSGSFRDVDDDVLAAVAASSALTSLSLRSCTRITAAGIAALGGGGLRNLQVLSLHSVRHIDDLAALAGLPSLRDLDLSWCLHVRTHALPPLHRLHRLLLRGCELVDDSLCAGFDSDGSGPLPELVDLDLAYTRLGDGGLLALAASCPRLRRLAVAQSEANLWSTGMWTEAGLREFARRRPEVRLELVC